jgi:superfamily II DNA/RNA helicase
MCMYTKQIFTATRHHAEYLHGLLQEVGLASSIIYGAMDMEARKVIKHYITMFNLLLCVIICRDVKEDLMKSCT